jgi:protein SCO1/2
MKRRSTLLLSLLGLASLAAAAIAAGRTGALRSGVFSPPRAAPDFTLEGSDGAPLTLARFRGKVVVLEFGFTRCAKVCPVTLGSLTHVFRALGTAASEVQLIFVTVDPARDDAARLRQYLGNFDARFLGATGARERLAAVRDAYGVLASKEPEPSANRADGSPSGYQVHHSSSLYLIDRKGTLRALVPFGASIDDIVHDLELLLKE